MLNQRFHHCLSQCKQLNGQSLSGQLGDSNTAQLTADKLLYNHAIELVLCNIFSYSRFKNIFHCYFLCIWFSVSQLLWMSYLVIRPVAAVVIKRLTYFSIRMFSLFYNLNLTKYFDHILLSFFIVWHNKLHNTLTKAFWTSVSFGF